MKFAGSRATAAIALLIISALTACTGEAARVQIQDEGVFEYEFHHDGSRVALWTDLDIEYLVEPVLSYQITLQPNEQKGEVIICDPLSVIEAKMERNAVVRGLTKVSYLGRMGCEVSLPKGDVRVRVDLNSSGEDVTIFRADLVFMIEE